MTCVYKLQVLRHLAGYVLESNEYSRCGLTDLLGFRLVCKDWNRAALSLLNHTVKCKADPFKKHPTKFGDDLVEDPRLKNYEEAYTPIGFRPKGRPLGPFSSYI